MWLDEVYRPLRLDESTLKGIIWASAAIALPFVPFRLFVRWKIAKKLFIDDYLVITAYCLLLTYAIVWQILAHDFFLVFDALSHRIQSQPNGIKYLRHELHLQVCSVILYGLSIWCIKLSFLFFFQRLGNNVQRQRILWWPVLAYTVASFVVWMALPPWRCIAASPAKIMTSCGDRATAQLLQRNLRIQTSLDVTSDVAVLLLPISLLWKLKIELRKKLILSGIFSLTVFIMVASIVRIIVVTVESLVLDESWKMTWAAIEMSVAVIVACLGSFRALYTSRSTSQNLPDAPGIDKKDSDRLAFAQRKPRHSSTAGSHESGPSSDLDLETTPTYVNSQEVVEDSGQSFFKWTETDVKVHSPLDRPFN